MATASLLIGFHRHYPRQDVDDQRKCVQFLVETLSGTTTVLSVHPDHKRPIHYQDLLVRAVQSSFDELSSQDCGKYGGLVIDQEHRQAISQRAFLLYQGHPLTNESLRTILYPDNDHDSFTRPCFLQLRLRIVGGMDRQNRVGSKFGGGGVSSSQQAERERKERLKRLALESIDLAKDPYLVRNHLGSYECKLCLTLHRDEANYLAHTQGKKHQQGLARRAHLDKLKQEREGTTAMPTVDADSKAMPMPKRVKIGRPAYQVFKSRDPETNQRCLSFEIQYPEISNDLQPRHRFMSAFEQRIETPPDRRYQYLLFHAEPYETIAFKIPNEPIDKGENRFVTFWDADAKKFTVSLYFVEPSTGT